MSVVNQATLDMSLSRVGGESGDVAQVTRTRQRATQPASKDHLELAEVTRARSGANGARTATEGACAATEGARAATKRARAATKRARAATKRARTAAEPA